MIIGILLLLYIPVRLYVEQFGTPVTATIDHHEIKTTRKGGSIYLVNYHFNLNGTRYDEFRSVNASVFSTIHDGDAIEGRTSPLMYLAIWFHHEHFVGPPAWSDGPLIEMLLFALGWNAFVGVFVYYYWIVPGRQRRLVSRGQPAPPALSNPTDRWEKAASKSPIPSPPPTASNTPARTEPMMAQAGKPCVVFYDPGDPSRHFQAVPAGKN